MGMASSEKKRMLDIVYDDASHPELETSPHLLVFWPLFIKKTGGSCPFLLWGVSC